MSLTLTKQNNFDFLRFVAASLVLLSHCFPLSGLRGEPFAAATGFDTFGGLAVSVFFVISGFLITASWTKHPKLDHYLRNRCLRILPGYYVATVMAVLLGAWLTTLPLGEYLHHPMTRGYFRNFSLYSQRFSLPGVFQTNPRTEVNGSTWTLPKEFTMYLLIAGLGLIGLLRGWVLSVLCVAAYVYYVWYLETYPADDAWLRISLVKNAVFFLSGALFWHYRTRLTLSPRICAGLLVVLACAAKTHYANYVFLLCLPYLVIFAGLRPVQALSRFGKYGDFSYGLYLYAFPVQQTYMYLIGMRWGFWAFPVVCWCVALCCAVASWHFVERPCLKMKDWSLRKT